jgi:hypothetical protein
VRTSLISRTLAAALSISAVIGSASPIAAQDPSFTPEQIAELERVSVGLQAFLKNQDAYLPTVNLIDPATLPVTFPYKDVQQHVVVDVAFGDDAALPFMFDTGAGTLVSKAIQEAHAAETVVESIGLAGGNQILISPTRRYPSLTVADSVTVTDALADDPWEGGEAFHCITPHGLFGASSMQHAVWQVDYGTQQITAAASVDQLEHIDGALALPFTVNEANKLSPTPHLTIGIGGGTIEVIVDTGGGIPLTIGPEELAKVGVEVPADAPAFAALSGGAAGSFESVGQSIRVPVTFGDTELSVPVTVASGMGAGSGGNIGHAFLRNFVVTFDFPNRMLYLDPLFEGASVPDPQDPPAVAFALMDGKVVVSTVVKGGPADQAGVKLGEVITQVDGTSVEGITADEYCAAYADPSAVETITTEAGVTYDASPIEGFWSSER